MRAVLISVLLIGLYILWRDDSEQRAALDNMTKQMQAFAAQKDQLENEVARLSNVPPPPPAPGRVWFQQRLDQAPSLLNGHPSTDAQ